MFPDNEKVAPCNDDLLKLFFRSPEFLVYWTSIREACATGTWGYNIDFEGVIRCTSKAPRLDRTFELLTGGNPSSWAAQRFWVEVALAEPLFNNYNMVLSGSFAEFLTREFPEKAVWFKSASFEEQRDLGVPFQERFGELCKQDPLIDAFLESLKKLLSGPELASEHAEILLERALEDLSSAVSLLKDRGWSLQQIHTVLDAWENEP